MSGGSIDYFTKPQYIYLFVFFWGGFCFFNFLSFFHSLSLYLFIHLFINLLFFTYLFLSFFTYLFNSILPFLIRAVSNLTAGFGVISFVHHGLQTLVSVSMRNSNIKHTHDFQCFPRRSI